MKTKEPFKIENNFMLLEEFGVYLWYNFNIHSFKPSARFAMAKHLQN